MGTPVGLGESPEEPTRTSIELPKLDKYNPSTAAIVAGDWLASLGPTMATLSTTATVFWEDSLRAAQGLYHVWVMSSPLERWSSRPRLWCLGSAMVGMPEWTRGP